MNLMTISEKGISLIKSFEGCKLYAYRDSVGIATIGYGHTKGVYMGMAITQRQADEFLLSDIENIEKNLNGLHINFRQNQFDALCSWIFNLGIGNFNSSTMKKYIAGGKKDEDITDQMIKWHNAGGKPLLGLKRRRIAEANMFIGKQMYYIDNEGNIKKRQ